MEIFGFGAAFLSWAFLSVFWSESIPLAVREIFLIIQAILISFAVVQIYRSRTSIFSSIFFGGVVLLGLIESLIGFLQVAFQGSIGWYLLGEPHLDIFNREVARTVVAGGGRFLRAYGTFVHPNVLGAFLTISFLCAIYLFIKNKNKKIEPLFFIILFCLVMGLLLTFSRAAWLVSFLMTLFLLFFEWKKNKFSEKLKLLLVTLLTSIIFLVPIFYCVIFPKLYLSSSEPAIQSRMDDLKLGWQNIKDSPFFGVGLGQPVYSGQRQPIHNLYLLIASETGLVGLILFLLFIISIIRNSFKITIILLSAILLLGMFDHYFWTIPAGQLMLWITIFSVVI